MPKRRGLAASCDADKNSDNHKENVTEKNENHTADGKVYSSNKYTFVSQSRVGVAEKSVDAMAAASRRAGLASCRRRSAWVGEGRRRVARVSTQKVATKVLTRVGWRV